eukprot:3965862-Amphidinium_carterae.1
MGVGAAVGAYVGGSAAAPAAAAVGAFLGGAVAKYGAVYKCGLLGFGIILAPTALGAAFGAVVGAAVGLLV